MPTYDYVCEACGHEFEHFQSMSDRHLKTCPKCKKRRLVRKIGAGAGLIFKGTGFYQTDYKAPAAAASTPKEAKRADSKSVDTPAAGGTSETKSVPTPAKADAASTSPPKSTGSGPTNGSSSSNGGKE